MNGTCSTERETPSSSIRKLIFCFSALRSPLCRSSCLPASALSSLFACFSYISTILCSKAIYFSVHPIRHLTSPSSQHSLPCPFSHHVFLHYCPFIFPSLSVLFSFNPSICPLLPLVRRQISGPSRATQTC